MRVPNIKDLYSDLKDKDFQKFGLIPVDSCRNLIISKPCRVYDKKNNKTICPSLINEAISWKFSTYAPGTKLFASNMEITVMGMMQFSDIWTIALYLGTGYGLFTLDHPLSKPLYPDLMFRPDNKFRRNLNLPEWNIYLPQCLQ